MRRWILAACLLGVALPEGAFASPTERGSRGAPPQTTRAPAAQPRQGQRKKKRGKYFREITPYHGIFIYGPRPSTHHRYRGRNVYVRRADLPKRIVNRDQDVAVGAFGGALVGGGDSMTSTDAGGGLGVRYRPYEFAAAELTVSRYGRAQGLDPAVNTIGHVSGMAFAFPWSRVSPYAVAGLTLNHVKGGSAPAESWESAGSDAAVRWGGHGGFGLEFALSEGFSLDTEARYSILTASDQIDVLQPGVLQVGVGLMGHF